VAESRSQIAFAIRQPPTAKREISMKKVLLTALLLSAAVPSVLAQGFPNCQNVDFPKILGRLQSPQDYTVSWQAIPGAYMYLVEERRLSSSPDHIVTRQYNTTGTSLHITHEAINDVTYEYRILAVGGPTCTMTSRTTTFGDPVLRRSVRRGIVPIAGSARGANGALFKTYLKLEGPGLRGRIVFHPVNRVASDDDPSIPYDTSVKSEWDDVVAAIGQSGIGSLSIVPEEGEVAQLPRATIRLYNVAANGIYGTNAEMYPGVGFLDANAPFQRIDIPADGNFRANAGVRAIFAGTARGFAIAADGTQKKAIERHFAAGEVVFGSPEAVYGVTLEPGETLLMTFSRAMIPFFTLTDNRTNDPFLHVQGAERTDVVDQYVK
jgi:hypothetical protein